MSIIGEKDLTRPYWRRATVTILGVALILRVLWALAVTVIPLSDGLAYDEFAQNIANGNGFVTDDGSRPTAYWPVRTSAIYALLYSVFGHNYLPILILNISLNLGTIIITMILTRKWFGAKAAKGAGVILALWPEQIQFSTILASDLIFEFLVILSFLFWYSEIRSIYTRAILFALTIAAASYVRTVGLLIPVVIVVLHLFRTREIRRTVLAFIVMFLVMAAAIAPWSYRNTKLFGQFTLLATNGGGNLWMGNNPGNEDGAYMALPSDLPSNEASRSVILGKRALEYIRGNPLSFAFRSLKKAVLIHSRETIGVYWNKEGIVKTFGYKILLPLKIISTMYWLAICATSILGLVVMVFRMGVMSLLLHPVFVIPAYFTVLYGVVLYSDRFHMSSVPFIAALAGFAISTVINRLGSRPGSVK